MFTAFFNFSSRVRYLKHYTRLNILYQKGFDFKNSSFLTLTVKDVYKSSNSQDFHKAKSRLLIFLKRKYNLRYFVSVSEFTQRGVLHYHLILFNVPYIPQQEVQKHWKLGFVKINLIRQNNELGAFYYVLSYISQIKKHQKHLRLVWSRSFQSDGWFSFCSTICVYRKNSEYLIDYGGVPLSFPVKTNFLHTAVVFELLLSRILYYENKDFMRVEEFDNYINLLIRYNDLFQGT